MGGKKEKAIYSSLIFLNWFTSPWWEILHFWGLFEPSASSFPCSSLLEGNNRDSAQLSYRFAVPCCLMVQAIFQIKKLSVTVHQKGFSFAVILHSTGINSVIQMCWSWGHLPLCYQHKTIWKGLFYKLLKTQSYHFFFYLCLTCMS